MKRSLLIALLLVLCLGSMGSAVYRGSASAWYFKAEFALNNWAQAGSIESKEDYLDGLDAITTAVRLDPSHPHYVHMLGRISHWGVAQGFESHDKLPQIKQWYLQATDLRPMWPDPWMDLARLNNFTEGFTQQTKDYMAQALTTGPYIDEVNTGVIKILLQNWAVLEGSERTLMFDQFRITTLQPNVLSQSLADAKSLGRQNLLCTQLKFNPSYNQKYAKSYLYRKFCKIPI